MIQSKTKWWILGIVTIVIVAAAGVFYAYHKIRKDPTTARQVNAPIPVKVCSVKTRELSYVIGATGTAKEFITLKLIAKIEAPVKSIKGDVGEIVQKNQLLAEYDGTVLLSELTSAETRLNKATVTRSNSKINLQRIKELYDKKLIAKVELERAEQEYSSAEAEFGDANYNLARVKSDISYLKVKSPIQGIILERLVNPGESPALKAPLFTLGLIDPIFMVAKVPEQNVGDIAIGQTAEIVFDAYPNITFTGKVDKIDANINPETRVFLAYIKIANKGLKLKPGLTGFSRISFKKNAVAILNLAVVNPTGQRATVFVVDGDNTAYLREIQTGQVDEGYTEVLSGLKSGEKIVAVGMRGLQHKDKVRIWEEVF
jgi:HlyD family secretion protein